MKVAYALLMLTTGFSLTACELAGDVKMDPTHLSYVASENLVPFNLPKAKLIRVAQFEDKRERREITGDAPRYYEFLIYGWQIGDFVTGDKVWTSGSQSVSASVSSTLQDCLKKTNFFEAVQAETSPNPTGGSGLILKGQVDSFYASQHLDWSHYMFGVAWGKTDELSSPIGHCKITYALVDAETGQELKRNTVEAEVKNNKISITEAGQQALSQANTLVINEVTTRALLE